MILNFDEPCLSLDGSEGRKGGRPEMTLHDPRLPYNGKQTNKNSLPATLVCGSNAAGEALPPTFNSKQRQQRIKVRGYGMMFSRIVGEWWVSLGLTVKDRGIQPLASTQRGEWMMTSSSNMCSTPSSLSTQTCATGLVIVFL